MRALLASPLGFLIGVTLGALGGGGSILAVPVLVYVAGQSAREATSTSLVLVTLTALAGLIPYARAGRIRWGAGALFGMVGLGGSFVGTRLNAVTDPDLLLLAFAGVMLVAAYAMWRRNRAIAAPAPASVGAAVAVEPVTLSDRSTLVKVAAAGTGVGLLTGFFGVGGGFVIVPALVLVLGFAMPEAVGTSLLVIAVNSMIALTMRFGSSVVDWAVVIPFAISSLAGVAVGSRLAQKVDARRLQGWFVVLLVAVALYTAVRSIVALVG